MSHLADAEIENIVRLVVERLRSDGCACKNRSAGSSLKSLGSCALQAPSSKVPPASVLQLSGRVISFRDIEGRLSGVTSVRILKHAIVTPAARDELSRQSIAIQRVSQFHESTSAYATASTQPFSPPQIAIIVSKSKSQLLRSMAPDCDFHLVPAVEDVHQIIGELIQRWRSEQYWIWTTNQPYAVTAAIGKHVGVPIRSIGLPELAELEAAFEQSRPNLLILDEKRWTTQQVVRLAKSWRKLVQPS